MMSMVYLIFEPIGEELNSSRFIPSLESQATAPCKMLLCPSARMQLSIEHKKERGYLLPHQHTCLWPLPPLLPEPIQTSAHPPPISVSNLRIFYLSCIQKSGTQSLGEANT